MKRLAITSDTVGPIARGHPWVYRDGLASESWPAGTPVQLRDPKNRPVAFGLTDEGPVAVRVLSRHPEDVPKLIRRRIHTAAQRRGRLLPPGTSAWRVINGAGDGLPGIVVDRYGPLAILRLYGACWVDYIDDLIEALRGLPDITIVARRLGVRRVDGATGLEHLHGPPVPETLVVEEAGLRFLVRPAVGQKTGLFIDQREHRIRVGRCAKGVEVINLFAYTGGFSVHAAAGGASRVTTVDIAPDAIDDAKENFRLNGLSVDRHGFETADAFAWKPAHPTGLVVCDPPNLSPGRKSDQRARAAYRDLATRAGQMTAEDGILATASCTARLSMERWTESVAEGLRKCGRWSWLWRAGEPPDHPVAQAHPEGRYLKFALTARLPA
jgi:23S rRNA (cytosine1962-C5)-methyltransferase